MSCDHILAPFRDLYLSDTWSQTLQTSKRHTFRVSAFHQYHQFGVKLCPVGCAQDSRRYPKNAKKCCFGSGSTHATIFKNFSREDPSSRLLWRFAAKIVAIHHLYIGLRVRYKYYKMQSFWFSLEPPTRRSRSKSAHKCIPYNNRGVQNFMQIGWHLAVRGPKTCFRVKTENDQASWPSKTQCTIVNWNPIRQKSGSGGGQGDRVTSWPSQ